MEWIIAVVLMGGMIALLFTMQRRINTLNDQLSSYRHNQSEWQEKLSYASMVRDWLMNTIEGGIILLDASQVVVMANPSAVELAGSPMVGDTLIAAMRHNGLDELVQQSLRADEDEIIERFLDIGGKIFQARIRRLKRDQQSFQLLTLLDVTALKRAERARRDMVANISHELRTPIAGISLIAQTLEDDDVRKSKQGRKMIASIRREIDTLTQLVEEMRELSRIESGQMPLKLTPTPLKETISAGTDAFLALAESKHQKIVVEIPEGVTVLADQVRIERVLKNILHNAIKFTQEGGTILVRATTANGDATVAIRDDGPGIPDEDLPRVFERFFQVDRSRKDGTGLGLAIARHIIIAHGGKIWAESMQGAGATFFFTLRLASEN